MSDHEARAAPTAWRLALSGAAQAQGPDGRAHALAPRDAALLAWLAVEGPTPRAQLAALLWPEVAPEAARNALRQRLFQLKRQLGVEIVAGSVTLALAEGVTHDLVDAEQLLGTQNLGLGAAFDDWLANQREARRAQLRQQLGARCEQALTAGDLAQAVALAHRLLALDPLSEEAHRRLMRTQYLAGDRAAALLAFDRCEQMLKHEIGARPSAETLALLQTVEQGAAVPAASGPRRVPASVMRPPRLIGREAERTSLQEAWDLGQPVLVTGDGGLGKSRLLGDFAAERGAVVTVSARPGDAHVVYATASRLLRQLPREGLLQLPGALRHELAHLLPELGIAPAIQGAAGRTRLFNAVAEVLAARTLGVRGCIVDDLHFADEASIELLQYAAASDGGACWAAAARLAECGPAAQAWMAALRERPGAVDLPLQPLTQEQVRELVASLAIEGLDPDTAAPALWRHTGGNPMYLLETVKAWCSQGDAALGPRLPTATPVTAVIARRIGQLSVQAVALARCAAIAAPDFDIVLASRVLGLRTLELADPWAELEAAQVLRDGAFAHDLIYEAARSSVPAPVARQLHAEIAAHLAERGGEPARLGDHWVRAERWPEAAQAWRQAAWRSQEAGRLIETAKFLAKAAQAFERAGDVDAAFEALLERARALASNDVGAEAQAALDALDVAARSPAQRLKALDARLQLAISRFEIDTVLALSPQALAGAQAQGDHAMALHAAIAWSGALGDARRTAEGVTVLEPLAGWVRSQGTIEQRWEFEEALALALDYAGRLREAAAGWQACEALAREAARPDMLWRSISNGAAGLAKMGRVITACEWSTQARRLALETGEVGRTRLLQMQAPHAHRLRDAGRYAEALPLLEEALAGFLVEGSATDVAMTEQRLALLFLHLGQPARAQPLLATPRPGLPPGIAMYRRVLQAELAQRLGGDAVTPIREALALVPDSDDVFHRIATLSASHLLPAPEAEALAASLASWAAVRERFGLALSGHVRAAARAADQGAHERALPHVEAARVLARDYQPESFYLGELWPVAARVLQACGRLDEARQALRQGRDWVMALHDQHVPAAFRDSFLHRNPANRDLFALAATLTPP
jgi:DNA-binding SARP family transcriptional activator